MIISTLALGLALQAAPTPTLSSVVAGIEQRIKRGDIRGAVLGTQAGEQTQVTGFGQVSRKNSSLPGPDTLFEIGSITKVFTSLLAQQQVSAQRASWDEAISLRIKTPFADPRVAAITWRELATHTSGLPRLPDNMPAADPLDPYAGYHRGLLEAFVTSYQPEALDKRYAYSNLGAGLLGELAAEAAGLSYAQALQRDVFQPLGMSDTQLTPDRQQLERMAQGFSQGADMPRWTGFDALAGAGGVVSSVSDLLRFARLTLNPEQAGAMAETLEAVLQPQGDGATGLGWHRKISADGTPLVWHNGGTGGYASAMVLNPASGQAVVLLSASTDYDGITALAFEQMAGESSASAGKPDLSLYQGAFEAAPGMVLTFYVQDQQLFGQATGQGAFPLTPAQQHQFTFAPANITVTFDDFIEGSAQLMVLKQAGTTTRAPRVSDDKGVKQRQTISVPESALAGLAGVYELAPSVSITVEQREGQLFAQLTGQSAFPVFGFAPDQFFYKVVDAELHFERDDQGAISGVTLVQGGRQFAPRKP